MAGPAEVTLTLGDGMAGELHRDGDSTSLARIVGRYTGTLEAGHYRLDAASLGRNDRLTYSIALTSEALQPGVPRTVTLPTTVRFTIARARVVSLTSYGNTPVKAVLHVGRMEAWSHAWVLGRMTGTLLPPVCCRPGATRWTWPPPARPPSPWSISRYKPPRIRTATTRRMMTSNDDQDMQSPPNQSTAADSDQPATPSADADDDAKSSAPPPNCGWRYRMHCLPPPPRRTPPN